jgi:hypothetical protein
MTEVSARYLGLQAPVHFDGGVLPDTRRSRTHQNRGESPDKGNTDEHEVDQALCNVLSLVPLVLQLSTSSSDAMTVYYEFDTHASIRHVEIVYAKSTLLTSTDYRMTQELSNLFQTIPHISLPFFSTAMFRHITNHSFRKLNVILNELDNLPFRIIGHELESTKRVSFNVSNSSRGKHHRGRSSTVVERNFQLVNFTTLLENLAEKARICRDKDKGEISDSIASSSLESLCSYARSLNNHESFRRALDSLQNPQVQRSVPRLLWLLSALGTYAASVEQFWRYFSHPPNTRLLPFLRLVPAWEPAEPEVLEFCEGLAKRSDIARYDCLETPSTLAGGGATQSLGGFSGLDDYTEAIQIVAGQILDVKWANILRAEIKLALHIQATAVRKVLRTLPLLNCTMYPDQGRDSNSDANWNTVFPPLSQPGCSLDEDRDPVNAWIDPRLLPVEHRLRSELWIYVETARRVAGRSSMEECDITVIRS